MSQAFGVREDELAAKIASLPLGGKEAKAVLMFSGEPVQGSLGIEASFAARVLSPFQNMVMNDYADHWHGAVGRRGKRPGEDQSMLLLTGLPRGSFGLELTKAASEEFFEEEQLADTLSRVTRLVEAAAASDSDFATKIVETDPRVLNNLKEFLGAISKNRAGLRLESGDFRCEMTPLKANEAFERVNATISVDADVEFRGTFSGITLSDLKFGFVTDSGQTLRGKVDSDVTQEQADKLGREFFNRTCTASLRKTVLTFKNGNERVTYVLKNLKDGPVSGPATNPASM
jgi:hypothetical protein